MDLSRSFGQAADVYRTARPDYPAAAVQWLLGDEPRTVADVGAGTGKLTAALVAAGHQVTAVEPDEAMLAVLRQDLPGVATLVGTGESTGLPDASVDACVFGQSWHWVDPVAACAEMDRVLRPEGILGLVWNMRDHRIDWVAALAEIMGPSRSEEVLDAGDPPVAAPFGELEKFETKWTARTSLAGLLELAKSRSPIITATAERREAILAGIAELVHDHPDLGDPDHIELPYRTVVFRGRR
ncbi:class I SAM-dependent methyltransferase [Parenemella sanctibonifatiensis]|uniref:SAM-dependent methyltransferase n=1 Tax=Parenemella sanctibonifatiensis TaxID=2016505 RepID=A0A255E1N5_9ACTN|nr:class I SAM-dependent methyltransferase [Parenemella sanctibonifatiensis]OYN85406.1 SAM-dependent methyltransferase [Parenemella sanctibonifatiensis]